MFRLWIERRFSRPVTAAGAVLKPQGGNCAVLPKEQQDILHLGFASYFHRFFAGLFFVFESFCPACRHQAA